jgi:transmembrane sensor
LKKEEAQELLKKYRLGQCTKKELEIINHWYQSFDNDEVDLEFTNGSSLNDLRKLMHSNILGRIDHAEEKTGILQYQKKPVKETRFLNFQNLKRIAAVLIVGVGLAFFFSEQNHTVVKTVKTVVKEEGSLAEKIKPKEMPPSTIYLSDGSVVWLKGESRLEYPKSFTGATREVTLIGEAFFDVAKDQEKPFIIHSGNLTTRVLGTSFNIKAYENDESEEIAVVTGKVSVSVKENNSDQVKEVVLQPKQKAIYFKKDNSLIEASGAEETQTYTSIAKTKLAFNETSLEDIIKVLNAAHDVNISVAKESMKNCIITADLTNETLEISIEILSKATNAEYTINEKDILLSGNGCRN